MRNFASMLVSTTLLLVAFASAEQTFFFPDCIIGPELLTSNLVCDQTASLRARAAAIIDAMTLEEKLINLDGYAYAAPPTYQLLPYFGNGAPRLGLPPYQWWNEALHGVADSPGVNFTAFGQPYSYATSFPMPILMSAAFDDDLIEDVATVISTEARAFSNAG